MEKARFLIYGLFLVFLIVTVSENIMVNNISVISKTSNIYKDDYKIKLLGNSRMEGGVIPSYLSKKNTFNYGLSGTGNKLWLNQLNDLSLDNSSNLIIIAVDYGDLTFTDYDDGNYINYLKLSKSSKAYKNLKAETKKKLAPFPFYYFGSFIEIFRLWLRERLDVTLFYENGANINLNTLNNEMFNSILYDKKSIVAEPNVDLKVIQFLDSIDSFKIKDDIIFINFPNYEKLPNKSFNFLKKKYHSLGRFINLDEGMFTREDFYDKFHLSSKGAQKVSKALSDSLLIEINKISRF